MHTKQYRPILVYALCILLLSVSGQACRRVLDPWSPGLSYGKVYVDSVQVADSAVVFTPVTIRVRGGMPDPSWSFDDFIISTNGFEVRVQPIGKHDLNAGIVPMVIVAYDESFPFIFLRSGNWTIRVEGRTRTLETSLVITDS